MIQRVKKPIKFCWMSSAIAIIVLAVLLQLAKWSLPHINYFNASLEQYIGKQLNAVVSIGHIEGKWTGLRPQIMVDDLLLESSDGQPLFAIDKASMKLDILLSLYHWTPVWHSVQAQGVDLDVTQDAEGGWSIGGISPKRGDRSWRYRSPSALFLMARDVRLESSKVALTLFNQGRVKTDIPLISIENNGHFHRLNAKAEIGATSAFDFILEGVGDPSNPDQFFAEAYLQLNRFPVERLSQLFGQAALGLDQENTSSAVESEANLEVWFDFATPSRFFMNGHAELINESSNGGASAFAKKHYLDIPVSADISGDYSIKSGLSVGLQNVKIDNTLSIEKAHFVVHDKKVNAAVDHMDLRSWLRWSEKRLIRSDNIARIITSLAPAGQLSNIYSTIDLLEPGRSLLSANVAGAQIEAWKGVPEFKNVTAYVEATIHQGYVILDTDDFSFFPDTAYSQPINAKRASGFIRWQLNYPTRRAYIEGYDLNVLGDYGELKGYFALDVGWTKQKNKSDKLTLQIGLKNSDALFHQQFVPKLLPKDLLDWMSRSIKSGEVKAAGLLYRGGLRTESDRTIQFFADLNKGRLDFSSDWPALNNLNGRLIVDNNRVFADLEQASVYKGDKFRGKVEWNKNNQQVLAVKARGYASAQSSLRYIRESWLNTQVGPVIKQVSGKGRVDVDVDLSIPLGTSSVSANQQVQLGFNNNQLSLNDVELSFSSLTGLLNYSTASGFESEQLEGKLFGRPIFAKVGGDESIDTLTINGYGSVDANSVEDWLKQPILSFVDGEFDYHFDIELPLVETDDEAVLSLGSNLLGLSSRLPQPFNKTVDQALPMAFSMPFNEGVLEYKLKLGQYLSGHFVELQDKPFAATIALSDVQFPELTSLPESGFKVVSQFENVDAKEWLEFIQAYPVTESDEKEAVNAFVSIDNLAFNEHQFTNIIVSGHREQTGWSLFVDSNDILGGVYIDDNKERPLIVDIDYLHWPPGAKPLAESDSVALAGNSLPESNDSPDFMRDIDPRTIPAADIKINRLVYKDKPLGSWSLNLRPDAEGLLVSNIVAAASGFTLAGKSENQGAFLRWQAKSDTIVESTRFEGAIVGGNPKALFEQWGLPFGLESEQTTLNAELFWLGSPLTFAVEKLRGTMNSYHTNGVFIQEQANDAAGILRLFGLLNFDSWARRVRLDFSDVYKKGITFDELKGELSFNEGLITLSQPVTMQGPSSKMALSGSIDYLNETVDTKLVATIPIGGNLTVVAGIIGGLPAAAGVYLVSKLFEKQVEKVSSVNYLINGKWDDPVVQVEKLGEEQVNQVAIESEQP